MKIEELADTEFAQFLAEVALPKFEAGTTEHGAATWKGVNLWDYIADEHLDLGWYHMLQALKCRQTAREFDGKLGDSAQVPAVRRLLGGAGDDGGA